jgi:thymidylate kinase
VGTHDTGRPPFVVVEGPNGAGKSTLAHGLARALGMTGVHYREGFFRARRQRDRDQPMSPVSRLRYYLAGVVELSDVVGATGGPVVADRYWASPLAALEAEGAVTVELVDRVGGPVLDQIVRPDLTLLLRARPDVLAARIAGRSESRSSASAEHMLTSPGFAARWMTRLRVRSAQCGSFIEIDTTERSEDELVDLGVRCVRAALSERAS